MPVVVHTREFGSADSYAELSRTPSRLRSGEGSPARSSEDELKDLFG